MMHSQVLQAIDFISLYMTNTYEASTSIILVLDCCHLCDFYFPFVVKLLPQITCKFKS